jgi:hypothetical protein
MNGVTSVAPFFLVTLYQFFPSINPYLSQLDHQCLAGCCPVIVYCASSGKKMKKEKFQIRCNQNLSACVILVLLMSRNTRKELSNEIKKTTKDL